MCEGGGDDSGWGVADGIGEVGGDGGGDRNLFASTIKQKNALNM